VLAEVARKYLKEEVEQQVVLDRLKKIVEASDAVPMSLEVAPESAKSYCSSLIGLEVSRFETRRLFDPIMPATDRALNGRAKVVTGDEHFRNLPETVWLG